MAELKCWEHMKCKNKELCPAHPDHGRDCWKIQGTLCRGERQGAPEDKYQDCLFKCAFLEGVLGGKF
ncbi:MAG: hypothetical protein V2B18_19190 [Pseudomonadota bacterium]